MKIMKKNKANRWSDYKPAETLSVSELDFVQPPLQLTFKVQGERTQTIDFSFMKERPQLACLFANVLLSEGGRYVPKTRKAKVRAVRKFNDFIECQRPEIRYTSLITKELIQEFVIWMTTTCKCSESSIANIFRNIKGLLKVAKSLYPNAFPPDFEIPIYIFPNRAIQSNSRVFSGETLQRLVAAANREIDEILKNYCDGDVPEGLRTLIPFMILLAAKTAINPESLYRIKRDCLKPHMIDASSFYVEWVKLRSKTGIQRQLHYIDPRGKGVIELLQFLIKFTQPLVAQAQSYYQDKLLLYRYRDYDEWAITFTRHSSGVNRELKEFCKRNQTPDIQMVQIRPSAATHHYIKTGGKLRKVQLLLGHKDLSTTERYIGDSLVQVLHNDIIRTAQAALVTRVITIIPKEAKQALADLADEVPSEQLQKIADGEYNTGICKCRNPFDSPQPGQKQGKCCTLFLACLTCPNALYFLEDLPRVIALRDYFLAERNSMRRNVWEALYQDKIKIIENDIIGAFSEVQVEEAEHTAAKTTYMHILTSRGVLK